MEAIGPSATRQIRVDLRFDSDCLELAVEDTGPGIPPEHRDRLFAKGFTTKPGDRGLGLYRASQRVAALGGQLTVEDRAGGGTVFRARIRYPAG